MRVGGTRVGGTTNCFLCASSISNLPSTISITACVFVEYYFVLSAIWNHQIYYVFGFMLLVVILLIICSAEVAIVVVYFYLSALDYRWWWNAFLCTSMSGVHFFLYSVVYFCNDLSMPYFVSVSPIAQGGFFLLSLHGGTLTVTAAIDGET